MVSSGQALVAPVCYVPARRLQSAGSAVFVRWFGLSNTLKLPDRAAGKWWHHARPDRTVALGSFLRRLPHEQRFARPRKKRQRVSPLLDVFRLVERLNDGALVVAGWRRAKFARQGNIVDGDALLCTFAERCPERVAARRARHLFVVEDQRRRAVLERFKALPLLKHPGTLARLSGRS